MFSGLQFGLVPVPVWTLRRRKMSAHNVNLNIMYIEQHTTDSSTIGAAKLSFS